MNTNPSGAPSATRGSTHSLPTTAQLLGDQPVTADTTGPIAAFLKLVDSQPHSTWIKKRKKGGKEILYIPIERVRWSLFKLFGPYHKDEVLDVKLMLNAVVVTVRLHYCIPGTDTWLFQDGVGAADINTASGQPAGNLAAIISEAVPGAAPKAVSQAVKNAAAKIGIVFGRDLNKEDDLDFTGTYSNQPAEPQFQQWGGAQTPAQVTKAFLEANPPQAGPVMPASQPQPQPIYQPAQQPAPAAAYAPQQNTGGYVL